MRHRTRRAPATVARDPRAPEELGSVSGVDFVVRAVQGIHLLPPEAWPDILPLRKGILW